MFSLNLKPNNKKTKETVVSNPKILEVNLIKKDNGASFDFVKNLSTLFLVFFIAALFVAEIYYGLDWWQNEETSKTQVTEQTVADLNREITTLNNQADEAFRYRAKVTVLSDLLDKHIYWTNFLSWLEKNTLSTVQYDSLNGDVSGIYTFNATAQTYAEASWQVKAFLNDPLTKSVSVNSVSSSKTKENVKGGQVSFTLNLEVDPKVFTK